MISESQQEQATLYALELLDADEADAFERQLGADVELRELVRDLREAVALLALTGHHPQPAPSSSRRNRVLEAASAERQQMAPHAGLPNITSKPAGSRDPWLPWAIAALFFGGAVVLLWLYTQQTGLINGLRGSNLRYKRDLAGFQTEAAHLAAVDPLTQVSFCTLEPTPDYATVQPRAAVLWDATHRQGKLRVNRLAPPASGKDYQLWTVETGRRDPVSAGVVRVDADGRAEIPFQPVDADGKPVVAVAISLEQAGGSPTNRGPILLLGKF